MLKRIGLGIILLIVSLVITLAMDVVVHVMESGTQCMFSGFTLDGGYTVQWNSNNTSLPLYQNAYFILQQLALANMLIDIAVLEFILSQSPYSVKGL